MVAKQQFSGYGVVLKFISLATGYIPIFASS